MFTNIHPYLCCNSFEFKDEIDYLNASTFQKLRAYFDTFNIYFQPINIDWHESDDYAKNGNLLRLLLHNIEVASPFFICLLGEQYGPHIKPEKEKKYLDVAAPVRPQSGKQAHYFNVETEKVISSPKPASAKKRQTSSSDLVLPANRRLNWIEKNLVVAQKTGYSFVINNLTQYNSILEIQIQTALFNEVYYPYYNFYYRKPEYLENKFSKLSKQKRKEEMSKYEAEDEHCEFKIKDLKARISRKGFNVKYYQSLEELGDLIFNDYIEIVEGMLTQAFSKMDRSQLQCEGYVTGKLSNYILTESIQNLEKEIIKFLGTTTTNGFPSIANNNNDNNVPKNVLATSNITNVGKTNESGDYTEILKLRHLELTNRTKSSVKCQKPILLITAPSGYGKTAFMAYLYKKFKSSVKNVLYLFYFLKPDNSIFSILLDVIKEMTLRYLSQDCKTYLDSEFYNKKSIIEQFQSALCLGPVVICIDGLSEVKNPLQLDIWLPKEVSVNCKFIFTLNSSSSIFNEIARIRKDQYLHQIIIPFKNDIDFQKFFANFFTTYDLNKTTLNVDKYDASQLDDVYLMETDKHNELYKKFLELLPELKTAHHFTNPLFCQIIAQEIYSFDKEIYEMNVTFEHSSADYQYSITSDYQNERIASGTSIDLNPLLSSNSQTSVNAFNAYIEETRTLRELIQKVITRYIIKHSWNINNQVEKSAEHPGWIGDVLCFICLSVDGIGVTKETIMRLLALKGYVNDFQIDDSDWYKFRLIFGPFITDGLNGALLFSHNYFKEAVQSLLLDGFSVTIDSVRTNKLNAPKMNISNKEYDIRSLYIIDILKNRIDQNVLDDCALIESDVDLSDCSVKYYELFYELAHHLYMIYDISNLCKILTNFKVFKIIYDNRLKNVNLWYKFLEYIRITNSDAVLKVILLNNLTQGMPFELNLESQMSIIEKPDSDYLSCSTSVMQIKMRESFQNSSNNAIVLKNEIVKTQDDKVADYLQTLSCLPDYEIRSRLIDRCLYLNKHANDDRPEDSLNLLLMDRILILNDLMLHLNNKNFIKTESISLFELINNVIVVNYPLSDNEKHIYTKFLDIMGLFYLKTNNFSESYKCFIKSTEILDDLYTTFDVNDLHEKFKNEKGYIQLSNRMSLNYSYMSLISLKLNDIKASENFVKKSYQYLKDTTQENFEYKFSDEQQQQPENTIRSDISKQTIIDSSFYEAKYLHFLHAALLEAHISNYSKANRFFSNALTLSINWFGFDHINTGKIYHYFGCYFAMPNTPFYNTRKAELYLRRALYIYEKYKNININDNQALTQKDKLPTQSKRFMKKEFPDKLNMLEDSRNNLNGGSETARRHFNQNLDTEEFDTIATVLYDLGCLLSTYPIYLSKKESASCLIRSLDIKTLLLGSEHVECKIIKSQLTDVEIQMNTLLNNENSLKESTERLQKRSKSTIMGTLTSRSKIIKCLKSVSKTLDETDSNQDSMLGWIDRNSALQSIRPSTDNFQSSEYLRMSQSPKFKAPRSFSMNGNRKSVENMSIRATRHQSNCYVPTAFSVDIHNANSIHGPNSALRSLLSSSKSAKIKVSVIKPIYYKSAWYDLPAGSSKKRFKQFQKLCPNN